MNQCSFLSEAVQSSGFPGTMEVRSRCLTHQVQMHGMMSAVSRCYVGQIEDAVDRGVQRIEALLSTAPKGS